MSRRSFTTMLAAAGLAPAALARGKTVAVIGAGLAGLAAARDLTAKGFKAVVFEARDRIGGRVWTSRVWPDAPVDMGASWIHGVKRNPLTAISDRAGIDRVATRYDNVVRLDAGGQAIDLDREEAAAESFIAQARARAVKGASLEEAITGDPRWASMSARERRVLRHVVNSTVEHEYSGDWRETSAKYYDAGEEFPGDDVLFRGGFGQVAAVLAKGLAVRLGQTVRQIGPARAGVRLSLSSGQTFEADHAVIAVPLGVLQAGRIGFSEPLRRERQDAIAALRMGLLNKCWLRFDRVAWPSGVDWIEWLGPRDGYWAEWVSLAPSLKIPLLVGFNAGDQARAVETLSDRDTVADAHAALKAIFGSSFPPPIAAQTTRWSKDPLTLGAYSFNAVGYRPGMRAALSGMDWDGRLVFAGEAASADYFGTAHGAYLSGVEAAEAIGG
jgi:monoamine oxidase